MSASSLDHLSDFHAWLQQKREQKISFLPWVRTLLNDETIMGMKWDDFVGKPRPNRAGKKLDAFDALFQVFSKERTQVSMDTIVAAQAGEEEEEVAAAVGDLTVAFEENLFLSEDEEEYDRPVTPPAQIQATGLLSDDAPPSSKLGSFMIEERKEVLSVVSWNTHSFLFLNRPEQRMGMARVLSRYDLVLLQEIPCGVKAKESLEYFCSVMNPGGDNPLTFSCQKLSLPRPLLSMPSSSGVGTGMLCTLCHCHTTYIQWPHC